MNDSQQHIFARFGLTLVSALVLLAAGGGIGILVDRSYLGGSTIAMEHTLKGDPVDLAPVWKAWNVIDEKFVPASVPTSTPMATTTARKSQDRVWGMISGLASSLNDPYTFFLPPKQNTQFSEDMSGSFSGVGMEIAVKNNVLTVVSPLKGTPADTAGIKSGDLILKINGDDTKGLDVSAAVTKIRGPKGSIVVINVLREGWSAPKDISVTRDTIDVPVVKTNLRKDGIFVLTLTTFTSTSPDLFRKALREFVESGSSKLILDLRGNPGGYLEAAVDMASWFLPAGKVVVSEDYAGHEPRADHRSYGYNIFNKNLKMAILVDKGSASASEILAGALKFYNLGPLIGTNTFGKGSVQELVEITPQTSLKLTVARWLGPDGIQIPITGIKPTIEATTTDEQVKAGKDMQLERAVKYVNSQE